ncbi:hypothetical protein BKA70DRAFT_1227706 [Coprinopsis sp. MPI-PUGE-AT-0042]|nr:hypothetical protein BKA70DRAFT_1227706 [Coprinopsis sp. MPI-PUGE-AT-0042]
MAWPQSCRRGRASGSGYPPRGVRLMVSSWLQYLYKDAHNSQSLSIASMRSLNLSSSTLQALSPLLFKLNVGYSDSLGYGSSTSLLWNQWTSVERRQLEMLNIREITEIDEILAPLANNKFCPLRILQVLGYLKDRNRSSADIPIDPRAEDARFGPTVVNAALQHECISREDGIQRSSKAKESVKCSDDGERQFPGSGAWRSSSSLELRLIRATCQPAVPTCFPPHPTHPVYSSFINKMATMRSPSPSPSTGSAKYQWAPVLVPLPGSIEKVLSHSKRRTLTPPYCGYSERDFPARLILWTQGLSNVKERVLIRLRRNGLRFVLYSTFSLVMAEGDHLVPSDFPCSELLKDGGDLDYDAYDKPPYVAPSLKRDLEEAFTDDGGCLESSSEPSSPRYQPHVDLSSPTKLLNFGIDFTNWPRRHNKVFSTGKEYRVFIAFIAAPTHEDFKGLVEHAYQAIKKAGEKANFKMKELRHR